MSDISSTTGREYYSGPFENIKTVVRSLNIGDGKIDNIGQSDVNIYQEIVDREIDAQLSSLYFVPIKPFNQVQPDGATRSVFPGNVRRMAIYWSAGLLLLSEYQGNETTVMEAAQNYIDDVRRELFDIVRFYRRIQGQVQRSFMSPTMPPNLQPPPFPESNF